MARGDFPSDKQEQFMVRFPDGMRDRIKMAAKDNNRSMNAEIIATLEEKYPDPAKSFSIDDFLTEWIRPIEDIEDEDIKGKLVMVANAAVRDINFPKITVWLLGPNEEIKNRSIVYISVGKVQFVDPPRDIENPEWVADLRKCVESIPKKLIGPVAKALASGKLDDIARSVEGVPRYGSKP